MSQRGQTGVALGTVPPSGKRKHRALWHRAAVSVFGVFRLLPTEGIRRVRARSPDTLKNPKLGRARLGGVPVHTLYAPPGPRHPAGKFPRRQTLLPFSIRRFCDALRIAGLPAKTARQCARTQCRPAFVPVTSRLRYLGPDGFRRHLRRLPPQPARPRRRDSQPEQAFPSARQGRANGSPDPTRELRSQLRHRGIATSRQRDEIQRATFQARANIANPASPICFRAKHSAQVGALRRTRHLRLHRNTPRSELCGRQGDRCRSARTAVQFGTPVSTASPSRQRPADPAPPHDSPFPSGPKPRTGLQPRETEHARLSGHGNRPPHPYPQHAKTHAPSTTFTPLFSPASPSQRMKP